MSSKRANHPAFTDAQNQAITRVGCGVLVSAAAGSGKTATLAHRVARLVADQGKSLDQILVLTFTENAAAEMRARIERVLRDLAAQSTDPHLRRQSLLAARAPISTIDSFCTRLLREHFEQLGIDPKFSVIPEEQATLLRDAVIRSVLDAAHTDTDTPRRDAFLRLVEYFGGGDDDRIGALVLAIDRSLAAEIDPAGWRKAAVHRLEEAAGNPELSELGAELTAETRHRVAALRTRLDRARQDCRDIAPALEGHLVSEVCPYVERWEKELVSPSGAWSLSPPPVKYPNAPRVPDSIPGARELKDTVKALKDDIKVGPLPGGLSSDKAFWAEACRSSVPFVESLIRLSEAFQAAYRSAKDARRCLDFADLERFALSLLRDAAGQPTDIALRLQGRFEYVLIDESQDINAVQNTLLTLISTDSVQGRASNLFSVGDVKQSIYRFRLAEPALFLQRMTDYTRAKSPRGQVILLKENFRSRAALLGVINAIFSRLMVDGRTEINYADGHALVPGAQYPPPYENAFTGAPAELHLLAKPPRNASADASASGTPEADSSAEGEEPASSTLDTEDDLDLIEREAAFIAHRIRQLMGLSPQPDGTTRHTLVFDKAVGDGNSLRPLKYADIAILLRSAAVKARQVSAVLRRHGVPVHADARGGLLEAQEVQDTLALLDLLDNPDRDLSLVAYLRSPFALLAAPESHLARARVAFRKLPLSQAVRQFAGTPEGAELAVALARLERWRELSARLSVAATLEEIFTETSFPTYLAGLPDGPQKQANLTELLSHAKAFSADPASEVTGFAPFIRALEELSDLSQPSVAVGEEDVVHILTIHKSKGLEFPIVFVPDLAKRFNDNDRRGDVLLGKDAFISLKAVDDSRRALYPSPAWVLARTRRQARNLAEELRVLYVALTRAREHLILVASVTDAVIARASELPGPPAASDHSTPLAESEVLSASSYLDWLMMATPPSTAPDTPHLRLSVHADGEISALSRVTPDAAALAAAEPDVSAAVLNLQPIDSTPPDDATAAAVLDRLALSYPHAQAAHRPAVISVTALTHHTPPPAKDKKAPAVPAAPSASETTPTPPPPLLPLPRLVADNALDLAPTERGTATHVAIEHFDFNGDTSAAAIRTHLTSLVNRRILTAREAGAVDSSAFSFLADSILGPYLRGERGKLHRELPIYLPGEEGTGLDRQMIRGRIDLLVATPEGPVIIDYKTDHVWGERLNERIQLYQGQVLLYRRAAEALLQPQLCQGVFLAFTDPKARYIAAL